MRNRFIHALALGAGMALAVPAAASDGFVRVQSANDVSGTMAALEAAVQQAGATIFARVDHAVGAASVDMALRPARLLIFGNPQLGTPAIQDDVLAGLALPLRVLAYEDAEGQTWIAYEDPAAMLGRLDGIAADAEYVGRIAGALENLTAAAAGD